MIEFFYKWSTLGKAIFNNILRNIAIIKLTAFSNKENKDHISYYKNLDMLSDEWFKLLPEDKLEQTEFLKEEGIKSYIIETLFFDYLIKNYDYDQVIDFGCGNGRLAAVLASNNCNTSFRCIDINKSTCKLNEIYKLDNLFFSNESIYDCISRGKTLLMARMSLAYLEPEELNTFLKFCKDSDFDLGIADITRFRLNKEPKISYTQQSHPVFSHPYNSLLPGLGFEVYLDVQKESALMNFTTYLFPEFLSYIYARKKG